MNEIHSLEKASSPEILKPRIRLEFLRHDRAEAESATITDKERKLFPEARIHSTEVGKTKNPDPRAALAYGSPRVRSQETAVRQLLASENWVTGEMSLDELNAEVQKRLKAMGMEERSHTKLLVTDKLDFKDDANPAYHEAANFHYVEAKDLIHFYFYESDKLVENLSDTGDLSYSRMAANVAELVQKYVRILPRWEQILKEKEKAYEGVKEMQRFFGTHATVVESFLIKVIEKTEGWDAADAFVKEMPDKNGFPYSEGVSVIIEDVNGSPNITLTYRGKTYPVAESVLEAMLQDRDTLNKKIAEKLSVQP